MAKKTKKQAENKPVPEKAPEVQPGHVSFSFSKEEIATLTNLLDVASQVFASLAVQASEQKDEKSREILVARHTISKHFINKLLDLYKMPEPTSRDIH